MSTVITVLRVFSLLVLAGPMLLMLGRRKEKQNVRAGDKKQNVRASDEEQNAQATDKKQNTRASDEEQIVRASEEKKDVQASEQKRKSGRAPVAANMLACALFFALLLIFRGSVESSAEFLVMLAVAGCLAVLTGVAIVVKSRVALGKAWSLVPNADQSTGLVTSGPYSLVRHPIYLGFSLVAAGEALVFGSWPAFMIVLMGMVPTFAWRAHAEEKLLNRTFSERYVQYRQRTKMIVPYLF